LLEKEREKVDEDSIKSKIVEIIKKDVFENRVFVFDFEEIPDNSKTKIIIWTESLARRDELAKKLNEFYKGKIWQNTYILILPEVNSVFSFEILEKGKRLKAAESLAGQIKEKEEKEKLKRIIDEERRSISDKLRGFYGYMIKWVDRGGELNFRTISIVPDVNFIREKANSDPDLCADFIVDEIKDKPGGVRVEEIVNNFKKFRRYPFILDEEIIYMVIRNLHKDKRVIIQGERGKWYIDESPRSIEPSYVVIHPKYAPEVEKEEDKNLHPALSMLDTESDNSENYSVSVEPQEVNRRNKKKLPLGGNSPRVILSQVEARTSEKDEFEEISIKYKFKKNISKKEIMKFIKQLPSQEECEISAEIVFWREEDEN